MSWFRELGLYLQQRGALFLAPLSFLSKSNPKQPRKLEDIGVGWICFFFLIIVCLYNSPFTWKFLASLAWRFDPCTRFCFERVWNLPQKVSQYCLLVGPWDLVSIPLEEANCINQNHMLVERWDGCRSIHLAKAEVFQGCRIVHLGGIFSDCLWGCTVILGWQCL